MSKVTVIPSDNAVYVDGEALIFEFDAPHDMHALQWDGEKGHIEKVETFENVPVEDYDSEVAPYVALWEAEKERLEKEAEEAEPTEAEIALQQAIDDENTLNGEIAVLIRQFCLASLAGDEERVSELQAEYRELLGF